MVPFLYMYIIIHILWNSYVHVYTYCTEGIVTLVYNEIITRHKLNWTVHHVSPNMEPLSSTYAGKKTGNPDITFASKLLWYIMNTINERHCKLGKFADSMKSVSQTCSTTAKLGNVYKGKRITWGTVGGIELIDDNEPKLPITAYHKPQNCWIEALGSKEGNVGFRV